MRFNHGTRNAKRDVGSNHPIHHNNHCREDTMNSLILIKLSLELVDMTKPAEIMIHIAKMRVIRARIARGDV